MAGLGLMGGSLALAVRRRWPEVEVVATSLSSDDLTAALAAGAIDEGATDPVEAAADSDLVVLATPLGPALELLPALLAEEAGPVVTDVVSLKEPLARCVLGTPGAARFVGGHPWAGRERSGWSAADSGLYQGRPVWLVRGSSAPEARSRVEGLWEGVGARPVWIEARPHDESMVWRSHLPQLLSSALASSLEGAGVRRSELGPGGTDVTRLAGSSPELWVELLRHAPPGAADALRGVADELQSMAGALEEGQVEALRTLLRRARRWKEEAE